MFLDWLAQLTTYIPNCRNRPAGHNHQRTGSDILKTTPTIYVKACTGRIIADESFSAAVDVFDLSHQKVGPVRIYPPGF